jgi:Heterokaryon incompatibility protein (HET)
MRKFFGGVLRHPHPGHRDKSSNEKSIYEPLIHSDRIHLLIMEPGHGTDPIQCHFETVRLNIVEKPSYEAISYPWRAPLPIHTVFVNGSPIQIRDNLYTSLCRFRDQTQPRTLCAEALCINQQDIPEVNQPVRMMATVFANSIFTLLWLGTISGPEYLALRLLQRCDTETQSLDVKQTAAAVDQIFFKGEPGGDGPTATQKADSFEALSRKPCFGHVWILQEFAVSTNVLFVCGNITFPLFSFELYLKILSFQYPLALRSSSSPFRNMEALGWFRSTPKTKEERALSFRLRYSAGRFGAMDARDQIFVLLGTTDDQTRRTLTVDYNRSVQDVFTEATAYCCLQSKNPFIML